MILNNTSFKWIQSPKHYSGFKLKLRAKYISAMILQWKKKHFPGIPRYISAKFRIPIFMCCKNSLHFLKNKFLYSYKKIMSSWLSPQKISLAYYANLHIHSVLQFYAVATVGIVFFKEMFYSYDYHDITIQPP